MTDPEARRNAQGQSPDQQPQEDPMVFEEFTGRLSEDFHFHFYFTPETRASAIAIRERLQREADFEYDLPPVRERPVGPHNFPLWSIWVDRANFAPATLWMARNHGPHSVLVHPNVDDGLLDHTDHAMWLGKPEPLKLEVFSRHE